MLWRRERASLPGSQTVTERGADGPRDTHRGAGLAPSFGSTCASCPHCLAQSRKRLPALRSPSHAVRTNHPSQVEGKSPGRQPKPSTAHLRTVRLPVPAGRSSCAWPLVWLPRRLGEAGDAALNWQRGLLPCDSSPGEIHRICLWAFSTHTKPIQEQLRLSHYPDEGSHCKADLAAVSLALRLALQPHTGSHDDPRPAFHALAEHGSQTGPLSSLSIMPVGTVP